MTMQVVRVLVGAALLLLGRQLYWIFVAGVGFVVAVELVPQVIQVESTLIILIIGLAAGIVGALLAVFLQKVAIGIAGFFAGGYAALALLEVIELQIPVVSWVLALVGAVIGVILTLTLFEWALIFLSSIVGAWMITQTLGVTGTVTGLMFLILLVVGMAVQALLMREGQAAAR